ncbi:MAG: hypothetical protein LC687_06110 [Actinobacteria bacterium]|nr:hypothetical protein [Actinomycetota bacterium]
MSEPKKTTLYVDANDEITAVITKLQDAPSRIVAIVLPKRAPVFQSIINVKLLKKAADKTKKKAVLVTSDKTVLPLAGSAGMYVAKTAQSKPYIPQSPSAVQSSIGTTATKSELDANKSVGELADSADKPEEVIDVSEFPKIELDDEKKASKEKKKSGVRIPNFNKFRVLLIVGIVLLILLGVGWYLAVYVLPRADVTIETATQSTAQTIEFRASPDQESVDTEAFVVPASSEEFEAEESATVNTTGERNDGERATGSVTVTNCESSESGSITIEEGTALTSSGGRVFRASGAVEVPGSSISGTVLNPQCNEDGQEDVPVEADEVGADYNISPTDYTVSGYSSSSVYGSGGEMSGGTDDIVQIVDQNDIRTARQQIEQGSSAEAQTELEEIHEIKSRTPLVETLTIEKTDESVEPDEGAETEEVTVSLSTTYSMLGVEAEDIQALIEKHMEEEIDFNTQTIVDDGLENASIRVTDEGDDGFRVSIRTIVAVGPEINNDEIAQAIAGLARSETESLLIAREGVRDVQIDYSPFWVFSTPDDPEKVFIEVIQQGSEPDEPTATDPTEPEQTEE